MRWIADEDKPALEVALEYCEHGAPTLAATLIRSVLANMRRLETEQSPQQPRVVPLSLQQRRAIYPERYS